LAFGAFLFYKAKTQINTIKKEIFMELLNSRVRTCRCGEFSKEQLDKKVTVLGWVDRIRDLGSFIFLTIRDTTGLVQAFIKAEDKEYFAKAQKLSLESVVCVEGVLKLREPQNINKKMKTGEVEVHVGKFDILSQSEPLPINHLSNEAQRLKFRYLDLRSENLQNIFKARNKITSATRSYLEQNNFIEIETPILGKSTPEGARDYLVPSRVNQGAFYALPQSPQLYKQLLMIAGFDRYYQIAKCFRDEDLRANRQPEFTQIDMELSFIDNENQVMEIMENLIKHIFREVVNIDYQEQFQRMTYKHAMTKYGSDKPDLRFGLELQDVSSVFKNNISEMFSNKYVTALTVKNGQKDFTRKEQDKLTEVAKTNHAKGLFIFTMQEEGLKSSANKFLTEEEQTLFTQTLKLTIGDIVFVCADQNYETASQGLGAVRLEIGNKLQLINKDDFAITWITEFPMFEFDQEDNRLYAKHHPFTSPMTEDIALLETNPTQMRAKAYDLVINGHEAGGGSVRIYNKELQSQVFKALGFTEEDIKNQFGFFVEAFKYGTPPHAGMALGLDRLTMLLVKSENIKDVIAFPKTQSATCLMTEAPGKVSQKQLEELGIKLEEK
jgi:aspartyl-tRNA synthetase